MKYPIALLLLCLVGFGKATPSDEQKKVAEDIANLLGQADFEGVREHFDPELTQALSADKIEKDWNALIAETGEFESVLRSQGASAQGFDIVEVLCSTHEAGIVVRVVFREGSPLVSALWIRPALTPGSQLGFSDLMGTLGDLGKCVLHFIPMRFGQCPSTEMPTFG